MRTILAGALLVAAAEVSAHEGHRETGFHWHSSDLLSVLAMVVAVGLWLWRRGRR